MKENKHILKVSEIFSETPGARYRSSGEYSAEEFRDDVLVPYMHKCKSLNCKLVIDLDGGYGYATCFLEEVFGGLVRLGFDSDDLLDRIEIISNEEPNLICEIEEFIRDAKKAKKTYKMP